METFIHEGGGASDSPKKENTSVPPLDPVNTAEQTDTSATDTTAFSSSTRYKMPTGEQGINLVISLVVPILLYWGLSWLLIDHDVNFFLSNLIGCGLALMVLGYIQSVFKSGSELATPIQIVLAFILILSLSIHYLPEYGKVNKNESSTVNKTSSFKSETLTFVGKERRIAHESLINGREYRMTVNGAPVDLMKSSGAQELTQEHGTYIFEASMEGSLIFEGTGANSTIMVEWQE